MGRIIYTVYSMILSMGDFFQPSVWWRICQRLERDISEGTFSSTWIWNQLGETEPTLHHFAISLTWISRWSWNSIPFWPQHIQNNFINSNLQSLGSFEISNSASVPLCKSGWKHPKTWSQATWKLGFIWSLPMDSKLENPTNAPNSQKAVSGSWTYIHQRVLLVI